MSESVEQMHKRLCSVIAAARFEVLSQPYAWEQVKSPSALGNSGGHLTATVIGSRRR